MNIVNNFLSETELLTVNSILDNHGWKYGFISNDPEYPIWNFDKDLGEPVAKLIASKLPDYNLLDYHINAQTTTLSSSLHDDSSQGASHAFVFFPSFWDYMWGGRLHIFNRGQSYVITPVKNMGVLFDASLPHYAEAPVTKNLRISIGLKLKLK